MPRTASKFRLLETGELVTGTIWGYRIRHGGKTIDVPKAFVTPFMSKFAVAHEGSEFFATGDQVTRLIEYGGKLAPCEPAALIRVPKSNADLRAKLGLRAGRIGNSPRDDELTAWDAISAKVDEILALDRQSGFTDSHGEKHLLSPGQRHLLGGFLASMTSGKNVYGMRHELGMSWEEAYAGSDPRKVLTRRKLSPEEKAARREARRAKP